MKEPVWKRIKEIAPITSYGLRNGTELSERYPVPVIEIAKRLDLVVEEDEIEGDGFLDANEGKIVVKRYAAPVRQRFTIAHELGHLCLGHRVCGIPECQDADQFALQLLMPASKVMELFELGMNLTEMSHYFQVSSHVMGQRLESLEIV